MRVKLIISYDGDKFCGFQRQNNVRNVQSELENTLSNILQEKIVVKGAGRTDAGVHALGQVVCFDTSRKIIGLKRTLNKSLNDIRVRSLKVVNDDFHARFSAIGKVYLYKIKLNCKGKNSKYICVKNVDIEKMKSVSKLFVGKHDFHNFVSGQRDDYQTVIYNIKFYKFGNYLTIKFEGAGFYRYMVRNLVGAMLDVGRGKVDIEVVKKMLDEPNERRQLSTSLPNGLYLYKVLY